MTTLQMQDYWLGMRINGGRYAISTKFIHAVFLHPEPEQGMKDLRINGAAFDKSGNLWVGNGWSKNGIKKPQRCNSLRLIDFYKNAIKLMLL